MGAERKFELVTSVLKTSLLRDHAAVFDVCPAAEQAHENVAVDKLVANATSSSAQHINILMHDTAAKDTTVEALPKIIEHYKSQGYFFEALTVDSYPVHHSVNN